LVKLAKSFGFENPPRVDITLGASMGKDRKNGGGKRREYGRQNPQGSRKVARR